MECTSGDEYCVNRVIELAGEMRRRTDGSGKARRGGGEDCAGGGGLSAEESAAMATEKEVERR